MLGVGNYLWRLIPGNPILLRVVEGGSRRRRDLLIRCGYLGLLVFMVFFLLLAGAQTYTGTSASLSGLAKQSASLFRTMSYVQLGLVALLAPVFTAGAITQEKDSQTYDILLSTPLSNAQIVLGSLLSRMFFVVALLVSGIPVFSITQIFGGVAIGSIVMSFAIACATAFVTGALATAIAVFKVGTRRTILNFYLFVMVYLAVPMVLDGFGYLQVPGSNPGSHISWFAGIHPFLALRVIFSEPEYMPPDPAAVAGYAWPINWALSSPQTFYVAFMFTISVVLVVPAIMVLRKIAQSTTAFHVWILQSLRLIRGDRTRKPRRVWVNPVAWREARTRASAGRALFLRYGFVIAGLGAAIVLSVLYNSHPAPGMVVSSEGFNAGTGTVTIVDRGEPHVYQVRSPRADLAGTSASVGLPTELTVDGQSATVSDVRGGLTVQSYKLDQMGDRLTSLVLATPHGWVTVDQTRQFLLGLVLIEFAVILLMVTNSSASAVTREKEDGTLDLLLTTPITSRYYIWGKLYGLVGFVLPLAAVPVLSVLLFVVTDLIRRLLGGVHGEWVVYPEAVLVLPGTLVMTAAVAAMVGMNLSLRCRKTVVAVMGSVGIVAGLCFAMGMCGMGITGTGGMGPMGIILGSFSPFTSLGMAVNPHFLLTEVFGPGHSSDDVNTGRWAITLAGWAAAIGYAAIVYGMYRSMVHNFDMTVRRQAT